jgi:RNA polymerase sigma-70 factor, ECF subfamily
MAIDSTVIELQLASTDVDRAIAGDEAAFTRIVASHHADLLRIARVVCGDIDLAAEASQAAWAVAWRRLPELRDPSRLRPWLMTIAANEARQLLRSRGRRRLREIARVDPTAPAADAGVAARIDLANALATLDSRDRTLLGLRYLAGLDSPEIARQVGMSATAVRSRMSRALERLRKELGDE